MYKKAVIITAKDVQDEEFLYPYYRLQEDGFYFEVMLCGSSISTSTTCGKYGIPIRKHPDAQGFILPCADPTDYSLIVIPGGWAPEAVRMNKLAVEFVRRAHKQGSIISAICHGPQVLISAGLCNGRRMTGYDGIVDDLENAGATYAGQGTFVDGNIITADHYRENPKWMKKTLETYYAQFSVH